MRELHWGFRKARIWLDELPNWTYAVVNTIERHQGVIDFHSGERQLAAVELFLPRGRALYGGLGGVFIPEDTHRLVVQVCISKNEGELYEESLARRVDEVYRGLPQEYVEGVFEGVLQDDQTRLLGAGTLCFSCAVHGRIGSSLWIFQRLSRIIINLLLIKKDKVMEEDLMNILQLKPTIRQDNEPFS